MLLLPGLPLLGLLVFAVRLTSPGPAIFTQRRVGKNGRAFTMYKLRSMRPDAEKGVGPVWASVKDGRVTPLGRFLRKLHLDELPQLFNVLKGEMSLIGPRPERPEFVAILEEQIPGYSDRLTVLPGVTVLAQINLPPDQTLDDVRRKLILDREYIEQAGVWLDLRMLVCTLFRMIGVPGALATRLTGLERRVELPAASGHLWGVSDDDVQTEPSAQVRQGVEVVARPMNGNANGVAKHGIHGLRSHESLPYIERRRSVQ
jgi:lipopolysaccharide/colanic/teichoic acid biosynthesis glycosyltransferase